MLRLRLVRPLDAGKAGDPGLVGPGSIVWSVAAEKTNVLGGLTALLLQLGYVMVADGVARKSMFQQDAMKRLQGTLEALLVVTYGDRAQAEAMKQHVARMHMPVHGDADGRRFSAFDPDACKWVWATIVELALAAYCLFVRPLSLTERGMYYHMSKPAAGMFGVKVGELPKTYPQFQEYFEQGLQNLVVDDQARSLIRATLHGRLYGIPIWPMSEVIAAGMMPNDALRRQFGLRWGRPTRLTWWIFVRLVRAAVLVTPRRVRQWQHHRIAVSRIQSTV